jgi:hypothetical protein
VSVIGCMAPYIHNLGTLKGNGHRHARLLYVRGSVPSTHCVEDLEGSGANLDSLWGFPKSKITWKPSLSSPIKILLPAELSFQNSTNRETTGPSTKQTNKQTANSVALVHKLTISTEREPLVGEVSANFCWKRVLCGQHNGSLQPYSRFYRPWVRIPRFLI